MRSTISLVVASIALLTGIILSGCDSSSNAAGPGGGTGTTDQSIVGVWFTLSDTTGFDIKSDGTAIPLFADNTGIIRAATAAETGGVTYKIFTSGTTITISVTIPANISATGRDTTLSFPATYALSNNNTTLTITTTEDGQQSIAVYTKTSIGANAFTGGGGGGGGGSSTFSFSVDGTTYNGSVVSPSVNSGFFSATSVQSGTSLNMAVQASTGTKNVSSGSASGLLSLGSSAYYATAGTITVTAFSGTNIKGTINFTMTESGGTATKTVTGSFDINY